MKGIFAFVFLIVFVVNAKSQGCVIIRNMAGFGQFAQLGYSNTDQKWMMNISGRYFESITPFKDDVQLPLNPDPSNRNINYNHTYDLTIFRLLDNGWALGFDLPIVSNTLVSRAEHYSGDRHSTHAFGIGDMRLTVYKWILKQNNSRKWNIQAGLGLKLPTGDYRYQDYFYNDPVDHNAKVLAPVDPSLQPGDGGTGVTTELNGYYRFNEKISLYTNLFYMVNPRDVNGTSTLKGHQPGGRDYNGAFDEAATLTVNSVPDNYTIRIGGNYTFFKKLVASVGFRHEGVPKYDLIGNNDGLRRVGHVGSIELGAQYKLNNSFFYLFVPIAVDRGLAQSVPDEIQSALQSQALGTTQYKTTIGRIPELTYFFGYAFVF